MNGATKSKSKVTAAIAGSLHQLYSYQTQIMHTSN
jgi:hypothetical protein